MRGVLLVPHSPTRVLPMAKHRRNHSLSSQEKSSSSAKRWRTGRSSPRRAAPRELRFEPLEERQLLAVGPQLIDINPNNSEVLEDGEIRNLAPQELTFRFDDGQVIDAATLDGIRIRRSGQDGVFGNGNDVVITPGFVGIGDRPNEVTFRFADALPDDRYRVAIFGAGLAPLRNISGEPFNDGIDESLHFELDLGAQVIAVVQQPVTRDTVTGALTQAADQIVVYFNNDTLDSAAASNPAFFRLIDTADGSILFPSTVNYDQDQNSAVLVFADDLPPGTFHLQIGASEELNDTLNTATNVGTVGQKARFATFDSPIQEDPEGNPFFPPIPDQGTLISTITVDDWFIVSDLEVQMDVEHSWGPDLRVFLTSPEGTRVELIRDLGSDVLGGQIYGTKFDDLNGDGVQDPDEPGLEGWTIYLDHYNNGLLDPGEHSTVTDSNGDYALVGLDLGTTYTVAEVPQPRWRQTFPPMTVVSTAEQRFRANFSDGSLQTIRFAGNPTSGEFSLGFAGRTTAPIAFAGPGEEATTAANIQAELSLITDPWIAVAVTGGATVDEYEVAFTLNGVGGGVDHPILRVDENSLDTGLITIETIAQDDGFTSTGPSDQWHLSTGRGTMEGHTGLDSFYFGSGETLTDGGTYKNNADGTLTSPVIDLSDVDAFMVRLNFHHLLDTESGFDFASVSILPEEGQSTTVFTSDVSTAGFESVSVDISQFAGQRIQVEFTFVSDGSVVFEGWYVDDVAVGIGRRIEPVSLLDSPGMKIKKNVDFGGTRGTVVGPDGFGYEAFAVTPNFEDITATGTPTLQTTVGTGFAIRAGDTGSDQAKSMARDTEGNLYVTGSFQATVDFDPDPTGSWDLTSAGGNDIFVAKYSEDGGLIWARQIGGTGADVGNGIAVDSAGDVYITGSFSDTVDFDPGTGVADLTSVGGVDGFVAKLDTAGDFVWGRQMGGPGTDVGNGIALDPDGNVLSTGFFSDTADFDPGVTDESLTSFGNTDVFVSKLDAAGDFVWVRQMGGILTDRGNDVAVDAAGNVHTTGSFFDTADFDPNLVGVFNLVSAGSADIFVSKLDSAGNLSWAQQFGGAGSDRGNAIEVDVDGNVWTTGVLDDDVFVAKLNSLGIGPSSTVFSENFDSGLGGFVIDNTFGSGGGLWHLSTGRQLDGDPNHSPPNSLYYGQLEGDFGGGTYDTGTANGGVVTSPPISLPPSDALELTFNSLINVEPGFEVLEVIADGVTQSVLFSTSNGTLPSDTSDTWKTYVADLTSFAGSTIQLRFTFDTLDSIANDYEGWYIDDITIIHVGSGWLEQFGGAATDSGEDVAIDAAGNVSITGSFRRTVDFGDGTPLDSAGGADIFVVRMDGDGNLDFVRTMGGTLDDFAYGLVLADDDNIYTTGSFRGTVDFDIGATTASLTSMGATDAFLTKLAVPVGVDDDFVHLTPPDLAGFEFEFYGETYGELFFSSNGLITFETPNDLADNTDLTDPPQEAAIAPFWEDMTTGSRSWETAFWEVLGTDDAQRLIIQWNNLRLTDPAGQITGLIDFQAVLRERDNSIHYNYRSVTDSLALPLGDDTPVGSHLKGTQKSSDVAADASGNYVVVWESLDQDDDLVGVFARQFLPDGTPVGDEFQVNTTTVGAQSNPSVAVNASGDFVVVWEGNGPGDTDGIVAQLFDSSGGPKGGEIEINLFTSGVQAYPDVKMDDAGNFLVTWSGAGEDNDVDGVFARQFDATGQPLGLVDEVQLITFLGPPAPSSTFTLWHRGIETAPIAYAGQNLPDVTATTIEAALRGLPNTGDTITVTAVRGVDEVQTITFTGDPTSGDFELDFAGQLTGPIDYAGPGNEDQTAANIEAALVALGLSVTVTAIPDYDYTVTFTGPDGLTDQPLLVPVVPNNLDQGALTIAETAKGEEEGLEFEVTFLDPDGGQDQPLLVHGDRLNGVTHLEIDELVRGASGEFRVNSFVPDSQSRPEVTLDADSNFVISWDSNTQDGDVLGVFAKRFDAAGVAQPGDTDEVQRITLEGPPLAGSTFSLRLDTDITQTIFYMGPNSGAQTAQEIQIALQNLGPAFTGVTVEAEPGASDEVQLITFSAFPQPTAGTFILAHRGLFTAPIAYAGLGQANGVTTAQNIQDALNALPNVGGGILVAPMPGPGTEDRLFVVTFAGVDGGVDHPLMVVAANQLNQGTVAVTGVDDGGFSENEFLVTFAGAAGSQDQPPLELEDNTGGVGAITTVEVVPGSDSEFQVNFEIAKDQGIPTIASRPDGSFVVVWQSDGQDGDGLGLFAQLYEPDGTLVGTEFQVNTFTEANQNSPKVAVDTIGNFVIVWQSAEQDGDGQGIYARRFTADGTALGDEFLVNTLTGADQQEPAINMGPGGDFVVTWTTSAGTGGIHAQQFDASGTPVGGEIQVSMFGVRSQDSPAVARDAAGNFVVVWKDLERDPDVSPGIYGQLFDADGQPLGPVDEVQQLEFVGPPASSSTFTLIHDGLETGSIVYEGPGLGATTAANIETALRALPNTGDTLTVTPVADMDEVQTITFTGGPTSGDFTLSFTGQVTQSITYAGPGGGAATAANIEVALQALGVEVSVAPVAATSDDEFVVTFTGADAGIDQPFLALAVNNLDQGSLTVVETVKGADTDDTLFEVAFLDSDGGQDLPLLVHGDKLNGVADLQIVQQVQGVLGEFSVPEQTDGEQDAAAVAMDEAGTFVVVWETFIEDPDPDDEVDGPLWDVHARLFDAAGQPLGGEFQVNTTVEEDQLVPDVAIDPDDGSFVIVWQSPDGDSSGVFGQRYDAAGNPIGDEFQVNTETDGFQGQAAVAKDLAGNFVVTWTSFGPDAGIYGQRYDAAGVPQGDEFQINTTAQNGEEYPDVAMDAAGNFVAVWESYVWDPGLSTYLTDVFGQRFDSAGEPLGDEFQISDVSAAGFGDVEAKISMAPNGEFVVAWYNNDPADGVIAQRFSATGVLVGSNFQVNTATDGEQTLPSVAVGVDGEALVTWLDNGQGGVGVFAQRFLTENPSVGIKAAGPQAVGEDVLQIWINGERTDLVGPGRSTKIAEQVVVPDRLFVVDSLSDQIHELDSLSGAVVNSFPTPEPAAGADVDLAFAGGSLYYLSRAGGMLYELHPDNGAVVDSDAFADLGFSGDVSGLAYLDGLLVTQDVASGELLFVDPLDDTLVRSVAGAASPRVWLVGSGSRGTLFAVESGGMIVELDPDTGSELNSFASPFGQAVGLAFAEGGLFVGDGSGSIALLDPDTGAVIESFSTSVPIAAFGADAGGGVAQPPGGNYQPLSETLLDDEATIPITAGVGPFTGRFRPVEPLSAFDRENVHGNWQLEIIDTAALDTGLLHGWTLIVNDAQGTPPDFSTIAYIGDNLAAGGGQPADDVDLYRLSLLGPATLTVEVAPAASLDPLLRLFDADGVELAMVDATAAGQTEVLSVSVPMAGTYFVGVSSSGNLGYSPVDGTGAIAGGSTGSYRLNMSSDLPLELDDDNSSFASATDLGILGIGEQSVYAEVRTDPFSLEMPGGLDEPGHRQIPPEAHVAAAGGVSGLGGGPTFGDGGGTQPEFAPDRLLIRFNDEVGPKERMKILQEEGLEAIRIFESTDALLVRLPSGADVLEKAAELAQKGTIRYAEPDYILRLTQLIPNDPQFAELWGLNNTGLTGGTFDADIDAPEAWDTFVGSANVVVAVIDTGVDNNHPDLAANMWRNPGEIAGNGIDDDGNGFVDDVFGWDFFNNDNTVFDDPINDDHGTHVAGTIAAVGNNSVGVAGVNWSAQIMALKFLGDFGFGSTSDAIAATDYMTLMKTAYGINVVASNNSWGGGPYSQALRDAIEASNDAGIIFIAAAGNDGMDTDVFGSYPSGYDLDGIISVAATDADDGLATVGNQGSPFNSNYGATTVDLGAPGVGILSTTPDNTYDVFSGTSMAAPHVTGVAALLAAFDPTASVADIKEAILLGADPVLSLTGITVTGARLNAAQSLALMGAGVSAGRSLTTSYYNFQDEYGVLPSGDVAKNAITENQQQRAREVFELYGHFLGIQFVETADQGLTVVTGDMRAVAPTVPTGPGGVTGIAGGGRAVMDAAEDWGSSEYGGSWFQTAMHEIGHTLGMGHTYDLPALTIMGDFGSGEPVFPGDHDLVHGSYLFPQSSTDVDLYRFEVIEPGWFTAEAVAERLGHNSSLLNTQLTLYRVTEHNGSLVGEVVARNDDYYSNDSFIGLHLDAGTYSLAVTSTGNTDFDPAISDSGFGGTTEGEYEFHLNFAPRPRSVLVDATGTDFDGDADGVPGGVFDFWFQSGNTIFVDKANDTTVTPDGDGTLGNPFDTIASALELARFSIVVPRGAGAAIADGDSFAIRDGLNPPVIFEFDSDMNVAAGNVAVNFTSADTPAQVAAAIAAAINGASLASNGVPLNVTAVAQDDRVTLAGAESVDVSNSTALLFASNLVRIVGNGGVDDDLATLADNRPYLIGFDNFENPLPDGAELLVPQGVTVMIDAGALFKMRKANIDVGSSAVGIDRSHGALQVLGTPVSEVLFHSLRNDAVGGDSDGPSEGAEPGDWGGMVFRKDSDLEEEGIFLNWVNHADINHGGGKLLVDSVEQMFTPVHLIEARPTVSFNTITNSADAAISADPNSFADSLGRIGPDIHGNLILDNSVDGLFVRIRTEFGRPVDRLDVLARWDDTDVVHVVTENLHIAGTSGGPQLDETTGRREARLDGRLVIDPGVIVKLEGSRIEVEIAGQLIAEGQPGYPVVFTALSDDSYGGSGTFDTNTDGAQTTPAPGHWGGIVFNATSSGSLDHVLVAYAGGLTPIEGDFDQFNAIEIHQADVRLANSVLRDNAAGQASTNRNGRGSNSAATIFVRGAQPIIVNNVLRDNAGATISINANALQSQPAPDLGRATGTVDSFEQFGDNHGPLVRLNRLQNNATNGMEIRGGVLTTETVWDDVDIVHVVSEEITVLNHHTFSGLRLQSSAAGSLVVKFDGPDAGLTADGTQLDIDDRIGGTIQIVGTLGHPVVLTSLADDSASAGFGLGGQPLGDTGNDGPSSGEPGQWRSIRLDRFSNDRNVAILREQETPYSRAEDTNRVPDDAEFLGNLAPDEKSGDGDRRLGFEIHGFIGLDNPSDVDVYSFDAAGGTEIWIDIDRTSAALDTIVELVDADGTLLARSLDNDLESLSGLAVPLIKEVYLGGDFYTTNPRDAGMRVVLPGDPGESATYYVRVRSAPAEDQVDDLAGGLSRGEYQLQIRLRQVDEQPGSTVRNAEIRFATNGIEVLGLPAHSPLIGESAEWTANNDTFANAQPLGNLLGSDRNTISVAGDLSGQNDLDWYQFTVDYDLVQAIGGWSDGFKTWAAVFDIDYADGISRPDTVVSVFEQIWVLDQSGNLVERRNLVLVSRDSNIEDDQPGVGQGADTDDLTRGGFGTLDPYIGTVQMPAGVVPAGSTRTYYVAISSNAQLPLALDATFEAAANNSLVRLEPVNSVLRIADDHIGFSGYTAVGGVTIEPETELFDIIHPALDLTVFPPPTLPYDPIPLETHVVPFTLSDVVLFVSGTHRLYTVDAFDGGMVTNIGPLSGGNGGMQDIAMRSDGRMFGMDSIFGPGNAGQNTAGRLVRIDTGAAGETVIGNDTIPDFDPATNPPDPNQLTSNNVDALAYDRVGFNTGANVPIYDLYYAVRGARGAVGINPASSTLYLANPGNGDAVVNNARFGVRGEIFATTPGDLGITTGMAFSDGRLYGVSNLGYFYEISPFSGQATNQVLVDPTISFAGLSLGPQNLEDGAYADLLFAITSSGDLYALDNTGVPQPIFEFGAIFASTNLFATGLAFSPLDFNLWHPTMHRRGNAGHGINEAFDESRPLLDITGRTINLRGADEAEGGASFYFGLETWVRNPRDRYFTYPDAITGTAPNAQWGIDDTNTHRDLASNTAIGDNYNLPGGALGSLVTNSFSLASYVPADNPTLYFNYFLETPDVNSNAPNMRDSARVFVSADGGTIWYHLTTNNSVLITAELPFFISPSVTASTHPDQRMQESFDNTGWRQNRVDLSEFAGQADLIFRFDFSTAGSMNQFMPDPLFPSFLIPLPGDIQGNFFHEQRGQNNNYAGFFIDDIIVAPSERGEMVTASVDQTTFFEIPPNPDLSDPSQVLVGPYQLEVRRGTEYGETLPGTLPWIDIFQIWESNDRLVPELRRLGDDNLHREQGHVQIEANTIRDVLEFGIVVDAGPRGAGGSLTHPGAVLNVPTLNTDRLVPGVTIENNVIFGSGEGGISFSGDPNAASPLASVPFGRILNNTIYGGTDIVPPSLPPVTFAQPGTAVPMFGTDSDLTVVPPPGVIPNDDLSTAIQNFGFTFEFYGNNFTQFYINNNGNISFTQPMWDFSPTGFPAVDFMTGQSITMVAPFWADVDTRPYPGDPPGSTAGSVHFAQGTSAAGNPFIQVDWVDVGYYDTTIAAFVPNLGYRNSFTLYIEDDPIGDIVAFGYPNMEWTTGEVDSPLMNGFGGVGAQIGFDAGNFVNFLNVARPNSQTDLASLMTNNNGQIVFQMDPNTGIPIGSGGGAGILITDNASPTILNNIVAKLDMGIDIDPSSSSTVVGANLFQNNVNDGVTGSNPILLAPADPLFVDPASGNFYLASGSSAIDSSLNTLADRPNIGAVKSPLGIPSSSILAPERDRFDQLRIDDPSQDPPPGLGANIFKDRGAVERADFEGPLAKLIIPPDGDGDTFVQSINGLSEFVIQISDDGIGVADGTVDSSKVSLERDGVLLVLGQDYTFIYDGTNDQIRLTPVPAVWVLGAYHIVLDNSAGTGIKDIANNPLQANRQTGTVEFTIQLGGGADFGDAPDPSFPTLRPAGASHEIVEGFFLGFGVDADGNGQPSAGANADAFDDGVSFDTGVSVLGQSRVTIRASAPGRLDAWIDYNHNGVWEAAEQIFVSEPLAAGLNTRTFTVPGGANAVGGESYARFRFSSAGGLTPDGAAADGEVEDYQVQLETPRWRNPSNHLDVNGDGQLAPQDALLLSNFLYFNGQQPVPDGPGTPPFPVAPPPYYDVNGDGFVTVQDGLLVVAALRNQPAPEGEQTSAQTEISPVVFAEAVAPPVTVTGVPSTKNRLPIDAVAPAGAKINGDPLSESTALSSNRAAWAAFLFEETLTSSMPLGGLPSISNSAVPTVEPYDRVASAVDRIMSDTFAANDADFVGGAELIDDGWSTATPANNSDELDDFFAQLDEFGELVPVGVGSDGLAAG